MRFSSRTGHLTLFLLLSVAGRCLSGQTLTGLWQGQLQVKGVDVPFKMEFSGRDDRLSGSFFNGPDKVTSTAGSLDGDTVHLTFDYYASDLHAKFENGELRGEYGNPRKTLYSFSAHRKTERIDAPQPAAPRIDGQWELGVNSPKGEHAWRLLVKQPRVGDVSAAILRVDGDTGTMTGSYQNGKFVLSHFSGARPSLLEIVPAADGSLELTLNGKDRYTAVRTASARSRNLPLPTDPGEHTTVSNPAEPLRFSFPDLSGRLVSNTDARFRDKVLIVNIMGSWCPNCHDEAPYLEELYREYHSRGLEIVSLDFEESGQLEQPDRLRAFIKRYGIDYTVLIAGKPDELNEKLPQAVNLNAWPTTFFIGRDGRVRSIHAGFAAKATGEFHDKLIGQITATVNELLGENSLASR